MKIRDILNEKFLNLFPGDPRREQYKDEVFDMLQKAYADIGGIKGDGFSSPDEMVEKIPMWKLGKKNGRIVTATMYKDKGGRKVVATATDETDVGKGVMGDIARQEPKRAYGEKSKKALGFFLKHDPEAKNKLIPFEQAQKVSNKDTLVSVRDAWPPLSDAERKSTEYSLDRWPFLRDYGYFRKLGEEWVFKVMFGETGHDMY